MDLRKANPDDIVVDEMNERASSTTISEEFLDNVEEVGIIQPPLVRMRGVEVDATYSVVVGQRRVEAARQVKNDPDRDKRNVTNIPVVLTDWDDGEAVKASITENIDLFRNDVSMRDRAEALRLFWQECLDGEGHPATSEVAHFLGVPRETVRTWLEPLREEWSSTSLDPGVSEDPDLDPDDLGERKLAEIRRMTGGGEEGEAVAEMVADAALTQSELSELRALVEDEEADYDYEEAIEEVRQPDIGDADEPANDGFEATVKFGGRMTTAISEYADDHDTPTPSVIVDAVKYFLREEGYLE